MPICESGSCLMRGAVSADCALHLRLVVVGASCSGVLSGEEDRALLFVFLGWAT